MSNSRFIIKFTLISRLLRKLFTCGIYLGYMQSLGSYVEHMHFNNNGKLDGFLDH